MISKYTINPENKSLGINSTDWTTTNRQQRYKDFNKKFGSFDEEACKIFTQFINKVSEFKSNNHVFEIICGNDRFSQKLEFLYFDILRIDRKYWDWVTHVSIHGDLFLELVSDKPENGIMYVQELPPETMYRIETTNGKLLQFQQSQDGPDYAALTNRRASQNAIIFEPEQICHIRLGGVDAMLKYNTYPYGVSYFARQFMPEHVTRWINDGLQEIGMRHLTMKKWAGKFVLS